VTREHDDDDDDDTLTRYSDYTVMVTAKLERSKIIY
jgi:hypothetical protein